jgi:UDP-N-acetylglucosamine--N-acetylmuramyl-(pentapeptide) pyrophosphoryl-undecaprenol N-acetylglucosamine transferase
MPKLLVMAGGTGGHVFPGLAVAHTLQKQAWEIEWLGTADKMEADIVPKHGFAIHFVDIAGLRGKGLMTKLGMPLRLIKAFFQARALLKQIKPDVVLGMGGYASGPGGLAAYILGVPLVVHEQNAVFGMTNRYLSKLAKYTLTGFDLNQSAATNESKTSLHYVGNPIRHEFFDIPLNVKSNSSTAEDGQNSSTNILIVGGSLGALALNQKVPLVLKDLAKKYSINVHHQSGKGKHQQVIEAYAGSDNCHVTEFIDDMQASFSWADIIICRAGALTVAEVAGAGRCAIFVPLPIAVDDHQTANARSLSDHDAAILLPQNELDTNLAQHLTKLCTNLDARNQIAAKAREFAKRNASDEVASFIKKAGNIEQVSSEDKRL